MKISKEAKNIFLKYKKQKFNNEKEQISLVYICIMWLVYTMIIGQVAIASHIHSFDSMGKVQYNVCNLASSQQHRPNSNNSQQQIHDTNGSKKVKIPANTKPGQYFQVSYKGTKLKCICPPGTPFEIKTWFIRPGNLAVLTNMEDTMGL